MCIPFKYFTFTLLTVSISCKLMIFLGTWVNIFSPVDTAVIISITWNVFKAITLLVIFFHYMLDMDLRIGIWNTSTTNYKCTSFKPVGFTAQIMEFMFMKWVINILLACLERILETKLDRIVLITVITWRHQFGHMDVGTLFLNGAYGVQIDSHVFPDSDVTWHPFNYGIVASQCPSSRDDDLVTTIRDHLYLSVKIW